MKQYYILLVLLLFWTNTFGKTIKTITKGAGAEMVYQLKCSTYKNANEVTPKRGLHKAIPWGNVFNDDALSHGGITTWGTLNSYEIGWCLYADGFFTIQGSGDMPDYDGTNLAPWLDYRDNIKSIEIGEGITSVGDCAFSGVYQQDSTTVFYNENSTIKSVSLPSTLKSIEWFSFAGCTGVTSITVPDNVEYLNNAAFYECTGIQSATLGKHVYLLGNRCFEGCTSLSVISIPFSVNIVGEMCFKGCSKLKSVEFLSSQISFYSYAFANCTSLHSFKLGATILPKTWLDMFYGCDNVSVYVPSSAISLYKNDSYWKSQSLISYTPSITVCDSGKVGEIIWTFSTDGVLNINGSGSIPDFSFDNKQPWFSWRHSMFRIVVNEGITKLGSNSFAFVADEDGYYYANTSVTSVKLPSTLKEIGAYSFFYYQSLESLYIPSFVDSIGDQAMRGCIGLTSLTSRASTPPLLGSYVFYDDDTSIPVYVPESSVEKYKAIYQWSDFTNIQAINSSYDIVYALQDSISNYSNKDAVGEYSEIDYVRNFSNIKWQALYVPFSIAAEEWAEDFEMARINDVHQYDDDGDGTIDRIELEAIRMKSGATEPNTPYLIRAYTTGEKTLRAKADPVLYATEIKTIDCSSMTAKFTMSGTYSKIDGGTMLENKYYALSGGKLSQTVGEDSSLGAFRWYMAIEGRGLSLTLPSVVNVKISNGIGEETTGIDEVVGSRSQGSRLCTNYYSLDGSTIAKPQKGITIRRFSDGTVRKVIAK